MGGAITNLTAVKLGLDPYDPDRVQAAVLERSEIDRQIELYRSTGTEERRAIVGLQPKRAEVILAGACIVRTVMDKLGAESLVVSDRGLRHGVLEERFGAEDNERSEGSNMTTASAAKPRAPRAGREPRRMTDEELTSLMGLLRGADSTELKLTVPPASHRDTVQGLPLDPVETQPRQVYFFDTPDLALNRAGLVVRARRIQGGKGDTVIKLRPVDPADLSPELRADASFNVEVDVLPGGYVCSASFKGRTDGAQIWDAVRGGRPLRKLFSKPQRAFFQQHAPEGIDLDALIPLGPTF